MRDLDLYDNVVKQCVNCARWDQEHVTQVPVTYRSPTLITVRMCHAGEDGPDIPSDPLLAEVHSGHAYVFTAGEASCANWYPDEATRAEAEYHLQEYEQELHVLHARGLYPGVNHPPL